MVHDCCACACMCTLCHILYQLYIMASSDTEFFSEWFGSINMISIFRKSRCIRVDAYESSCLVMIHLLENEFPVLFSHSRYWMKQLQLHLFVEFTHSPSFEKLMNLSSWASLMLLRKWNIYSLW